MNYIIYNKNTGVISKSYIILDNNMSSEQFYSMIEEQLLPNETYIDGSISDINEYYVDIQTQELIYRGNPPGNFYVWDFENKEWVYSEKLYEQSLIVAP